MSGDYFLCIGLDRAQGVVERQVLSRFLEVLYDDLTNDLNLYEYSKLISNCSYLQQVL